MRNLLCHFSFFTFHLLLFPLFIPEYIKGKSRIDAAVIIFFSGIDVIVFHFKQIVLNIKCIISNTLTKITTQIRKALKC